MLKFIGKPKRIEIRHIRVDGSANVDMEKENVKEIARSLKEGCVILHPSLVDKVSKRIVCGRDRILAQMRNDMKSAWVQYVTGDEVDFAQARIEENLCRREENKGKLREKLKADMLVAQEAIKLRESQHKEAASPPTKRGRPSEGKAEIDKKIAEKQGVSPSTVKSSISRAKKKAAEPAPEPEAEGQKEAPVSAPKISCLSRTLGLEVPEAVEDAAAKEQKLVDRMAQDLQDFGAALTAHREARAGLDAADDELFKGWEQQRNTMADAIRRSRPACLCPHCKPHVVDGTVYAEAMATCLGCRSRGYISEEKLENIEKALLAEGDDAGIWVPEKGKRPQWRTLISIRGEDFS